MFFFRLNEIQAWSQRLSRNKKPKGCFNIHLQRLHKSYSDYVKHGWMSFRKVTQKASETFECHLEFYFLFFYFIDQIIEKALADERQYYHYLS